MAEANETVERFLDIEAAARSLLASLGALKEESERHSTATESLESASSSISAMSVTYQSLVSEFESLSRLLREIGMPAVLEAQEALNASVNQRLTDVGTTLDHVTGAVGELTAALVRANQALAESKEISEGAADSMREIRAFQQDKFADLEKTSSQVLGHLNDLMGTPQQIHELGEQLSAQAQVQEHQSERLMVIEQSAERFQEDQHERYAKLEQLTNTAASHVPRFVMWGLLTAIGLGIANIVLVVIR